MARRGYRLVRVKSVVCKRFVKRVTCVPWERDVCEGRDGIDPKFRAELTSEHSSISLGSHALPEPRSQSWEHRSGLFFAGVD